MSGLVSKPRKVTFAEGGQVVCNGYMQAFKRINDSSVESIWIVQSSGPEVKVLPKNSYVEIYHGTIDVAEES
ncbi:unnamed protein product [Aspergillus niger]|nr:unnamed protein product [Aspergillus niger]